MRTRTIWLVGLLAAGMAWSPGLGRGQEAGPVPPGNTTQEPTSGLSGLPSGGPAAEPLPTSILPLTPLERVVRAQEYAPPDMPVQGGLPLPLYSTRPEAGGLYLAAEFVMFRQTVPLHSQPIAYRGFVDVDGSITGNTGYFTGGGTDALDANMVQGPRSYQPGIKVTGGWKFQDGSAFEVSWMQLLKAEYSAGASLVPQFFNVGSRLENTFLFSPVYNFPNLYAGPPFKISTGNPFAIYGIWNGATNMQLLFTQQNTQIEGRYRVPVYEDECWRTYGFAGPRFFWIWERFRWRTEDADVNGLIDPSSVAIYNNIVSNRMYGGFVGIGNEWWLGNGLSVSLDLNAAALLDVVKERASYELGIKFYTRAKRAKHDYTFVPELEGNLNLWWYPTEGIQLRVGYDVMAFFNTVAGKTPVDFNFGGLEPTWDRGVFRLFDGINAGIAIVF